MLVDYDLNDLVRYRNDRSPLHIEVDRIIRLIKAVTLPPTWRLLISGTSVTFSNGRRSRHIKLDISGRKVYVDVIRKGVVKSEVNKYKTLDLAYEKAVVTLKEMGDRESKIKSKSSGIEVEDPASCGT